MRVTKPQGETSTTSIIKPYSLPISPIVDEEERKPYDHIIGRCKRRN
ncbi:MAG: hypothetical protein AABW80_05520 [Nanoarchaeota archaeon]